MRLIIEILLMGIAVAIAAYLLPGVTVDNFWTAIVAGTLIALANAKILVPGTYFASSNFTHSLNVFIFFLKFRI